MALTGLTNLQPLHIKTVGIGTFDNAVSIGGTLTYEDVTNVDAIGIITARSGINVSGGQLDVGSNIKLGNAGVITATSFVGSGSGLTGLNSDLVNDSSPQLGGALDVNGNNIQSGNAIYQIVFNQRHRFYSGGNQIIDINGNGVDFLHGNNTHADNVKSQFGASNDLAIYHDGNNSVIQNDTGDLYIQNDSSNTTSKVLIRGKAGENSINVNPDGAVELYHNNVSMLETESRGAFVKKGDGGDTTFTVGSTDASGVRICLDGDSNGDAYGNDYAFLQHDTSGDFIISADNPAGNSNLIFKSGNSTERLRITSGGFLKVNSTDGGSYHTIRLNTTTNNQIKDVLHVHSSVDGATAAAGYGVRLNFSGEQSNGNEYTFGGIAGLFSSTGATYGDLAFYTNNNGTNGERLRITSSGQVRAGDESSSDRTSYRHQFSSTAGSGDVLSLQNPSNTDGQGIGLGFWARNTNNAAIEVAKIKGVADETQANSTQSGSLRFMTNLGASMGTRCSINTSGHFVPGADNTYDLGTSSLRWRDIYTGDLNLSNKGRTNDVDNSWGDWTLQEGESDVFMINNRSGKKFKIKMEEVN